MNVSPMMQHDDTLARARIVNKDVSDVILHRSDWLVYDSWSVNEPVMRKPGFYADGYHFPGLLTELGWKIILSGVCERKKR